MKRIFFYIAVFTGILFTSCRPEIYEFPVMPSVADSTLKTSPFPIGGALGMYDLKNNENYRILVANEFKSITAENAMKMGSISKGRGQYFWDDADYFVDFGVKNNLRVHGHTLIWYKQSATATPSWVLNFTGTKDDWKQLMKEYITAVMTRYKGKVKSWDVVNEAFKDDGTYRSTSEDIWAKNIGSPEYIYWAFQCAREADPDALLFYNDYGHEYSVAKRTAIANMVADMKAKNIPIDGIGMQMHTDIDRSVFVDIKNAIDAMVKTGLLIHISELEVYVNKANVAGAVFTDELAKKQATHYRMISKYMKDVPVAQRYGITTWGVYDNAKASPPEWPLLFDTQMKRKPAYYGVIEGYNMN